jgi:Tfp pilus assembly protein PilO
MSQQSPKPKRRQIRVNLQRFRSAGNSGMIGMAEIIALAGSLFVLVLVIVSYFYFFVPAKSNLATATQEQARLKTLLSSSRQVVQQGQTTEATVKKITESLEDFETTGLNERTQGRMDLYDELNELMRKNGLRNSAGPTYTVLDPIGAKTATNKSANTKWQSVYPGIAISVTVEGQYANLRRFVRDIEASKVFLVVNAVELERATEHNAIAAEGSPRASLVSLRLDMATYFQRSSGSAATDQTGN